MDAEKLKSALSLTLKGLFPNVADHIIDEAVQESLLKEMRSREANPLFPCAPDHP